jgi:hypothetical protein
LFLLYSRLKGNLELRGEELKALRTELEECRTQILATSTQLVQLGFNLMVIIVTFKEKKILTQVLRIRITLMQIRVLLVTLMRIESCWSL